MTGMPWFQFYAGDWLAGTRGLSAVETGVYITLIASMYDRGAPLPHDDGRLARLCGASPRQFKAALQKLVDDGKIEVTADGIWNHRVADELQVRAAKSETAKQAALARHNGKTVENQRPGDADASQTQCAKDASQMSDVRCHNNGDKSPLSSTGDGDDDFNRFMGEYPERDAYPDTEGARVAFKAQVAAGAAVVDLCVAASCYRQWTINNGKHRTKYVKQACKWLDGDWRQWLPKRKATIEAVASVPIVEGSPEWLAWKAAKGGRLASFDLRTEDGRSTGQRGCYQATQWPPGHEVAA